MIFEVKFEYGFGPGDVIYFESPPFDFVLEGLRSVDQN